MNLIKFLKTTKLCSIFNMWLCSLVDSVDQQVS